MLQVIAFETALSRLLKESRACVRRTQQVPLGQAAGRVLASDIVAGEDLPAFSRSSVDGYAVAAADTFGASAALPALLRLAGEVRMGERAGFSLEPGTCAAVWTGGEIPEGADSMVMLEEAEVISGGLIAVESSAAPGRHIIFRGDDALAGKIVLRAGKLLSPRDVGVLAAFGKTELSVVCRPRVSVLSTGDELVGAAETPRGAQVRDSNGPMLVAACLAAGAEAVFYGRVRDDEALLLSEMRAALTKCDLLLISGGSSAGAKDAAAKCLLELGSVLFHGLAVKPGKPTFAGRVGQSLVIGLPGHPAAAYMICRALVQPVLLALQGRAAKERRATARLAAAVPSNHGREEFVFVRLQDGLATPLSSKSGLLTALAEADGYLRIPRDTEGLRQDAEVEAILF